MNSWDLKERLRPIGPLISSNGLLVTFHAIGQV